MDFIDVLDVTYYLFELTTAARMAVESPQPRAMLEVLSSRFYASNYGQRTNAYAGVARTCNGQPEKPPA